jgi:hypothetical protein
MKPQAIRRIVIREWMTLPSDKRQTKEQTARFSREAAQRHALPPNNRTPLQRIQSWLLPRTARP